MNFNRHLDDRDRLMNQWRRASSPELKALVADVATQLQNYERAFKLRQRARRPADQKSFDASVEALVCDLVHRALTSENMKGRIAVSLDTHMKRSRYQAPCENKQFPKIVKLMATPEMDWLEVCELGGWQIGKRTAVRAGQRLLDRIDHWGIEVEDLCLDGDEEIVIQKRGKHDPMNTIDGRAEWIDYPESNIAKKYRREVRTINEYLSRVSIDYSGERLVDRTDKRLRRYFNNASFKQGGRLFGGFWQQLKSKQVKLLSINGRGITEVDFETMQIALARAQLGVPHDIWKDAYAVPGFESHRKGIKKLVACMLFSERPLKAWPRDTLSQFPPGTRLTDAVTAIQNHFPEFESLWFTGAGYRLMFAESQILVKVLLTLIDHNVPALPKHDCVVVPDNHTQLAAKVMRDTFAELAGGQCAVTVDGRKMLAVA